jgi:ferredoxin
MSTAYPAVIERPFKVYRDEDGRARGEVARTVTIKIRPGKVEVPAAELTWHEAQRFGEEILEAARTARIYSELEAHGRDTSKTCTVCNEQVRAGVVTTPCPSEAGRVRHVVGSPECSR